MFVFGVGKGGSDAFVFDMIEGLGKEKEAGEVNVELAISPGIARARIKLVKSYQ